jgi:hypothetical protein
MRSDLLPPLLVDELMEIYTGMPFPRFLFHLIFYHGLQH